jgi:hypothetical protein
MEGNRKFEALHNVAFCATSSDEGVSDVAINNVIATLNINLPPEIENGLVLVYTCQ